MRPPLPESPPEAARGPSVEVIILRLFPFIKVPAFLFAPGAAAAPEPRTPGLSQREGAGAVSSPTWGTGRRRGGRGRATAGTGARILGGEVEGGAVGGLLVQDRCRSRSVVPGGGKIWAAPFRACFIILRSQNANTKR